MLYPVIPILTGVICLILIVFIAPNGLAVGIFMTLFGVVIYGIKLAKRERILLMLTGTKVAVVILSIIVIVFTKNTFTMQPSVFKKLFESMDGILILVICGITLATVFFDIKPLDAIVRQRTKKLDSDAQVVSEIVELSKEKKQAIYRFNLALGILLLIMAAIMILYAVLMGYNVIKIQDNIFGTENMREIAVVIFTLFGVVLCINGFKRIYLELESRKIKI